MEHNLAVSVVIPVYNSASTLVELSDRLLNVLGSLALDFEVILVNDGSKDASWQQLTSLTKSDPRIVAINLTRNFGQHNALMCGLAYARGSIVITMDDDLQHPPEEIPKLLEGLAQSGADAVIAHYASKQHSFLRNLGTRASKEFALRTLGIPKDLDLTSFRAVRIETVKHLLKFKVASPRVGLMLFSTTTNIVNIETEHHPRKAGTSGYSLPRLVSNFLDNILNYSSVPLRFASFAGFLFAFIGFCLSAFYFVRYLSGALKVSGFTTLVLLITFFSGLILMTLGMVGEYLIRIIKSTEVRPRFIVREVRQNLGDEETTQP
jgi:polyisoprenyl-phosphate glycosyltransferase